MMAPDAPAGVAPDAAGAGASASSRLKARREILLYLMARHHSTCLARDSADNGAHGVDRLRVPRGERCPELSRRLGRDAPDLVELGEGLELSGLDAADDELCRLWRERHLEAELAQLLERRLGGVRQPHAD